MELYRARDRYSVKLHMLGDDSSARKSRSSSIDKNSSDLISSSLTARGAMTTRNLQNKKADGKSQVTSHGLPRKDALSGSESQHINPSILSVARKKRVHAQVCSCVVLSVEIQSGCFILNNYCGCQSLILIFGFNMYPGFVYFFCINKILILLIKKIFGFNVNVWMLKRIKLQKLTTPCCGIGFRIEYYLKSYICFGLSSLLHLRFGNVSWVYIFFHM